MARTLTDEQRQIVAAIRYSQQRSAFGKPICQHQRCDLEEIAMAEDVFERVDESERSRLVKTIG